VLPELSGQKLTTERQEGIFYQSTVRSEKIVSFCPKSSIGPGCLTNYFVKIELFNEGPRREETTGLGIPAGEVLQHAGGSMQSWNVIWWDGHEKFIKRFPGDKPSSSGALAFAKRQQERGLKPYIVSASKAFGPTRDVQLQPRPDDAIWCPYCLKYRQFHKKAILRDGVLGPELWRCPICTISIKDAYVRMYNEMMIIRLEGTARPKIPSEKKIRRTVRRR
jgi:hypothetical protein